MKKNKTETQKLNTPVVRDLVCMNLKRTCSALDAGKCKMIGAGCVFQKNKLITQ
jgi:hypothetical protein